MDVQPFWKRATTVIVGWTAGRPCKNKQHVVELTFKIILLFLQCMCKKKAIPLQAWTGPREFQGVEAP